MEKGSAVNILVVVVLILSAILVFIAWLPYPRTPSRVVFTPAPLQTPVVQPTAEPSSPPITGASDLDSVSTSLDTTDFDSMDSELNKLDTDASF